MPANRSIVVGLFTLGGFFLFALGLFWIGDRRLMFSDSMELATEFANVSGLKAGSKVLVSGMDAGEVLAIHVPPAPGRKFRVRFRVLSQFQSVLRADSVASIQVEGLVGSKVLQLDAGTEKGAALRTGATLPSREPLEIAAVIQQGVDLVKKVNSAVDDVQLRLVETLTTIHSVGQEAEKVVVNVGGEAEEVFRTTRKIATDVNTIVDGVRHGRGTLGKLVTDDQFYEYARNTARNLETVTGHAARTSEDVRRIVADLESRKLGENVEKTVANLRASTSQLKDVLAALKPPGETDERGLLDDVRATLENTREATGDLAENMEALKRNWFFRGFFNRRGFFDLDSLSLEDYRRGKIAPDRERRYTWLHAQDLFTTSPSGRETLSPAGRKKVEEAIVPYLNYAPNTLLIVEGYAGQGTDQERFLLSRQRAQTVRAYLLERFGLKATYVGAMPMGAVASSSPSGQFWEGVALVAFTEKKKN